MLLVLTFLNNDSNYKTINFVRIFSDKDLVIILVECHEDTFYLQVVQISARYMHGN